MGLLQKPTEGQLNTMAIMKRGLHRKAFAATALILDVGVVELKAFVEAFLGEIQLGAIDVDQTLGIYDDLDSMAFKAGVFRLHLVYEFQGICHT